ncbi:MAG: ABC-type transport auxiliary lipoprotein family protein [Marinobacter sp.]|uniref:ABC-type transport auxiliary lipoprotein family protein n=1 Tax=unclassified Marinobacter TaxID=83889 RepID=UPI00273BB803|nr:ABC-type transport auxiliary lipoprotein family protein [Marinobacter sp. MDS2]MDP4548980.1 ABC-type transport auxiliary lipoprotein family protein [Marinobacter sp. MDS2]
MKTSLTRIAVLLAALSTAACTVLPRPEPPRVMDLAPASSQPNHENLLPVSLRINTPLASDPVDSSAILLKPTAYEFQAYQKARWRDSAPVLVRDHLARHLRNSGGFRNVVIDTSATNTEHALLTELSAFQVEQSGNTYQVILELHAEVISEQSGSSLCVRNWSIQEMAASSVLESAVEAFSRASNTLASELTQWAWSCVQRAQ